MAHTLKPTQPSKVQISISNNALQDHLHSPINNNAFQDHLHSPQSLQYITRPSLSKSCTPRPTKGKPSLARPSVLARPPLPHHLVKLQSCILHPPGVNRAVTVYPSEEDLLLHLSTLVPLPSVSANQETWMPEEPCSGPTPPVTPKEELEADSPASPDSQTSTASYSLCPRLPDDTDGNQSTDDSDDTDGSPAEVKADSSWQQIESPTAGTGTDTPTPQDVRLTSNKVKQMPDPARKMPLQCFP